MLINLEAKKMEINQTVNNKLGIVWATAQDFIPTEGLLGFIFGVFKLFGFKPAEHFHITLFFRVREEDYQEILGKEFEVWVNWICFNGEIMAIPVDLTGTSVSSVNSIPHMTLMCNGVKPFMSNAMLAGWHLGLPIFGELIKFKVEFDPFEKVEANP